MRFKTNLKMATSLIDMTPLVDVVFLMLIFFIIGSDILPLKSLNVENPSLDRESTPLTTQLLVVMDAQNVIYMGSHKTIVDLNSLKNQLNDEVAKLKERNPNIQLSIVLSVDRRVDYGAFLRLFSIAQETGSRIRLAYQVDEEENQS
jgi:biopolymer transport protein ExbD